MRKKGERPTIFFVDMEIMRTFNSFLGKASGSMCCLLLCTAPGVLASEASDVVLQKVPLITQAPAAKSNLSPQATFALINYSTRNAQAKPHALYVSSGNDLALANSMIDDQVATSFGFSVDDKSPTAVIDLGKVCTVRRLSAVYSARPGSIDFYLMQSLPGDKSAGSVKLDSNALASLKRVGSAVDDGTQGTASVNFPATAGRYVMVRWIPAAHDNNSFTLAEVSAFDPNGGSLLASAGNYSSSQTSTERTTATDSKDIADSKDVSDSKDLPEVAAGPPAEGPPPPPPAPPPFTFIPQLTPNSL